ncbi:iron permease FTR1 [Nadsonia fulvescens var. elongata DSM 6958]|uniref:Iron permease FTR1 n=1 Tax=Nadsonia fulvescens var. elongata DSM 6958 TaxID=857566 RepID=A0A1E3PLR3_9ASCO|nr:iron permease FTR1 [Nadsonia fulvescens var. elongata DSM 6958]
MAGVFSVEVFFVLFRESLEASIILSVLLAFLKQGFSGSGSDQVVYKSLVKQVWYGAAAGLFICLIIGGTFIGVFYSLGNDLWAKSEDLWEGIFSLVATVLITIMGLAMLRINKMKEKWRVKLAKSILDSHKHKDMSWWNPKRITTGYAMAILPFITVLREGIEAIIFVGGVSLGTSASSIPLPVFTGLAAGLLCGYIIYRGGNVMSIQIFLIASTCFLYLIAAGLFSRGVWFLEMYRFAKAAGGDVAENGSGPGSYNIKASVWHVNCCNPLIDGGWQIFQALFGWQNSATFGSVISYNVYWICICLTILAALYEEKHGHWPLLGRFQKKKMTEAEIDQMVREAASAEKLATVKNAGSHDIPMDSFESTSEEESKDVSR